MNKKACRDLLRGYSHGFVGVVKWTAEQIPTALQCCVMLKGLSSKGAMPRLPKTLIIK